MITITRPYDGISLNSEIEYLRRGNSILKFNDEEKAKEFLLSNGFTEDDLCFIDYEEIKD